jgi:acyl CoA:acetate/3-ketoacid CoA transferase beta subunit
MLSLRHIPGTQGGAHKILEACNLPLTGLECVNRIITEMAVFDCTPNGLVLRELAPGVSLEAVRTATGMACDECLPLLPSRPNGDCFSITCVLPSPFGC